MKPYHLFFSHGRDDTYIVRRFLAPEVETSGASVFMDAGRIEYGDDFRQIILQELLQCDELLVLFTASALRRPWVFAEIGAALARCKRIVAVSYGPTETELQELGVLSLLGTNSLLKIEEFDTYIGQLRARVEGHQNA
jgi:hypothetical protein